VFGGNFQWLLTLCHMKNDQLLRQASMEQHISSSTLILWTKSPSLYVESRADLNYVGIRAATFLFYPPSEVSTASLIDAGLYYTGDEDICRCHECKIELKQLKFGDNPTEMHQLISPQCPLLSCTQTKKADSNAAQCLKPSYFNCQSAEAETCPIDR